MKRLGFLIIFASIFSCKDIVDSVNKSSKENLPLSEFKTVSVANLYRLSVPKYMKEMSNLNEDASFQYANIYKEAYSIVIDENKEDFINLFKDYGEYNEELSIVDNYANAQLNFLKENATINTIERDSTIKKINGLNAREVRIKCKTEGVNIGYVLGFFEGDENLYVIMNWTLVDRYEKYKGTFKKINASFNLIK